MFKIGDSVKIIKYDENSMNNGIIHKIMYNYLGSKIFFIYNEENKKFGYFYEAEMSTIDNEDEDQ